jgi:hypothetical protein
LSRKIERKKILGIEIKGRERGEIGGEINGTWKIRVGKD